MPILPGSALVSVVESYGLSAKLHVACTDCMAFGTDGGANDGDSLGSEDVADDRVGTSLGLLDVVDCFKDGSLGASLGTLLGDPESVASVDGAQFVSDPVKQALILPLHWFGLSEQEGQQILLQSSSLLHCCR